MKKLPEVMESVLFPWDVTKAQWAVDIWNQIVSRNTTNPAEQPMNRCLMPDNWNQLEERLVSAQITFQEGQILFNGIAAWSNSRGIVVKGVEITFQHMQYMLERVIDYGYRQNHPRVTELAQWVFWLQQIRFHAYHDYVVILLEPQVAKFTYEKDGKASLTMLSRADWLREQGFGVEQRLAPQWEMGWTRPAGEPSEALIAQKRSALSKLSVTQLRELLRAKRFKPSVRLSKKALVDWVLGENPSPVKLHANTVSPDDRTQE